MANFKDAPDGGNSELETKKPISRGDAETRREELRMPVVRLLRDGRRAMLVFDWDVKVSGQRFVVGRGFTTDFASVPRMFWRFIPPWGEYSYAAILHDWLYARNGMTRARADRVLLDAMRELGVGWLVRWMIYMGVRVGGWVAWNAHRRNTPGRLTRR